MTGVWRGANADAAGAAPADPDTVRATLEEVFEAGPYYLDSPAHMRWHLSWWLGRLFNWIDNRLEQLSELLGGAPMWVTWMIMIALSILVLLLLGHAVYSMFVAGRRDPDGFQFTVTRETTDPEPIAEEARRLARDGAYADAVRRLYLAALVLLENKRGGPLRRGLTNREYLRTFRLPWVVENLRVFVDLLETKWYRGAPFAAHDFERCQSAYETLAQRLEDSIEEKAS